MKYLRTLSAIHECRPRSSGGILMSEEEIIDWFGDIKSINERIQKEGFFLFKTSPEKRLQKRWESLGYSLESLEETSRVPIGTLQDIVNVERYARNIWAYEHLAKVLGMDIRDLYVRYEEKGES